MPGRNFTENEVDTGSGINPLGPSKKVKAAIRKAVKLIGSPVNESPNGLHKLFSSKFGLSRDSILLANSIEDLVHLVLSALKPNKVLVVGPAPGIYEKAALASGAEVRLFTPARGTEFTVSADELGRELNDAEIIFISNPNRVSGQLAPQTEIERLLKVVGDRKVTLVMDEALIEFTGHEGFMGKAALHSRLIVLRTTAFFYGLSGLELAYAISSPLVLSKLRDKNHCALNILAQEAAKTAIKDKTFVNLTRAFIGREKALLFRGARRIQGVEFYPSDSNTFLIGTANSADKLISAMKREGFSLRPCEIGATGEKFFSFSLMDHDRNKKFARILKENFSQNS